MTNLKSVNIGQNKFCGPAVLSILTGRSTDECARIISSINGKYRIEGVTINDLMAAADRLGYEAEYIPASSTLYGTLVSMAHRDGIYIVTVANHYIVIEVNNKSIWFCDNHTKEPMPAAASARLLQSVKAVHRVTKRREPVLTSSKIVATRRDTDKGIEIELSQVITYDIEKFNKTVFITRFTLANEEDLLGLVQEMKGY